MDGSLVNNPVQEETTSAASQNILYCFYKTQLHVQ